MARVIFGGTVHDNGNRWTVDLIGFWGRVEMQVRQADAQMIEPENWVPEF